MTSRSLSLIAQGVPQSAAVEGAAEGVRQALDDTAHAVESACDFPGRLVERHPWLVLGAPALAAFLLVRRLRRD